LAFSPDGAALVTTWFDSIRGRAVVEFWRVSDLALVAAYDDLPCERKEKGSVLSFDNFRGEDNTEQRAVARRLEPAADDRLPDQRLHWDGVCRRVTETSPSSWLPILSAELELRPGEGFAGSSPRFAF